MRKLSVILALLALTLGTGLVRASVNIPEPQPMTGCVYEDKNGWLDGDGLCTTAVWYDLHRGNLTLVTTGLHDGCNTGAGQYPSWNDCISSVYIPSVTAGYRVPLYIHIKYQNMRFCADGGGYWNLPYGTNDGISSFRVESGSC